MNDIRLLLVADAIQNSGKLRLEPAAAFDSLGFREIYLFPYPEEALILRRKTSIERRSLFKSFFRGEIRRRLP